MRILAVPDGFEAAAGKFKRGHFPRQGRVNEIAIDFMIVDRENGKIGYIGPVTRIHTAQYTPT
ncbi:MAG: hypothetical protein WDZ60_04555 [Wenzhouxiangellaceae bacterium]